MGIAHEFQREKLMAGVMFREPRDAARAEALLTEEFGPLDFRSAPYDFSAYTTYYEEEMGGPSQKYLISFATPLDPARLAAVKLRTNELEQQFLQNDGRTVNLDPGLLNHSRLILASTKDAGHRLPLRDGVYGEITLLWMKNEWRPLPWTYADYKSVPVTAALTAMRNLYARQV